MTRISLTVDGHARLRRRRTRMLLVQYLRERLRQDRHRDRLRHQQLRRLHGPPQRQQREVVQRAGGPADGGEVTTIEGLAQDGQLHPVGGVPECHGLSAATARPG